ncbi:MAG: flagellar export chaperone FlgN [Endozoicomonas sp.]
MNISNVMITVSDACELYLRLENLQHSIHRQLIARDITGLQGSLRSQSNLLRLINDNTARRSGLMQRLGFPVNSRGMRQLLSKLPPEECRQQLETWDRLQGLMFKCQMLSRKNCRIQARLQKVSQRLLTSIENNWTNALD